MCTKKQKMKNYYCVFFNHQFFVPKIGLSSLIRKNVKMFFVIVGFVIVFT